MGHRFREGDRAILVGTRVPALDGMKVTVVGVHTFWTEIVTDSPVTYNGRPGRRVFTVPAVIGYLRYIGMRVNPKEAQEVFRAGLVT